MHCVSPWRVYMYMYMYVYVHALCEPLAEHAHKPLYPAGLCDHELIAL